MAGEILKALCHYLKGKGTIGNKLNRHSNYWYGMYPEAEWVCWHIHTDTGTEVDISTHTNTYTPKHTQAVWSKHPQCTLGPHLLTLTAGFNTQVKLQWNIIIWKHLLTLTSWSTASLLSSSEQENRAVRINTLPNPCWSQRSREMKCKSNVSSPPNLFSLSFSFPIFSPLSPPSHLKNGVTFTSLTEKCCQRLSQSAEKFQQVSRSNHRLVNSKWYISGT